MNEIIVNIIEIIVAVLGGGFDGGQESSPAVGRDSPEKQQVVSSSQKYNTLIQIHITKTGKKYRYINTQIQLPAVVFCYKYR